MSFLAALQEKLCARQAVDYPPICGSHCPAGSSLLKFMFIIGIELQKNIKLLLLLIYIASFTPHSTLATNLELSHGFEAPALFFPDTTS